MINKIRYVLLWLILVLIDIGLMWIFGIINDMNIVWLTAVFISTAIFVYFIYRYFRQLENKNKENN
jgi:membrane protein implicated in regulation of membrane protease activity